MVRIVATGVPVVLRVAAVDCGTVEKTRMVLLRKAEEER